MPAFDINFMLFPTVPDQLVPQGDLLEIIVDITNIGLAKPIMYDMEKTPNRITVIDSENTIRHIPCKLVNIAEDKRHQTGNYKFYARTNTNRYIKGDVRILGETYNLRGEFIPVRQLHRII